MTLKAFRDLIDTLPDEIDVVHFRGLNGVYPRAVWQEGYIEQTYASNKACTEKTAIVFDYLTRDEEDQNVQVIKDLFRGAGMPFTCQGAYDEDADVISYTFNLYLEETV